MTLHEPAALRKPPSRFWLFAPYVAVLVAAAAWSVIWLGERQAAAQAMDQAAQRLRAQGFTVGWRARRISGYPFRLDVDIDGLTLAEPSGWGLAAPALKTEAYAYRLDHWIGYAPQGVVLTRPGAGAVTITGHALRASFTRTDAAPRVAVEGLKLVFTPQAGAKPYFISYAEHLGLYSRPLPGGVAEGQFQLKGAKAPAGTLLDRVSLGPPADVVIDARMTQAAALHGRDWPTAVRAWVAAGGQLQAAHARMSAGGLSLAADGEAFGVGDDGRLTGKLALDLAHDPGAVAAIGGNGEFPAAQLAAGVAETLQGAKIGLTFQAGATMLGPVVLDPAPKVY